MLKPQSIKYIFAAVLLTAANSLYAQYNGAALQSLLNAAAANKKNFGQTATATAADTTGPGLRIRGRVVSPGGEAVPFAALTMRNDKTRIIYGSACDARGVFNTKLPEGKYRFEVTSMGYEKVSFSLNAANDTTIGNIVLKMAIEELAAVTIKASNIRHNAKGYVMNVGNNPLYKGYDLTDVLATAPGITLTDKSIQSFGRNVVKVYIDERPVRFSAETLIAFLRSRRAENIRDIELVTSAGVDEEGSVIGQPVLRITTNRMYDGGFATITANSATSRRLTADNISIMSDMKFRKFSIYTRIFAPGYLNTHIDSEYYIENLSDGTATHSKSSRSNIRRFKNINAAIGLGYDFNDKNILTIEAGYNYSPMMPRGSSVTDLLDGGTFTGCDLESTLARHNPHIFWTDIYYVKKFDDKGRLTLSADWRHSRESSKTLYEYTRESAAEPAGSWRDIDTYTNPADSYVFSAKYSRPVRHGKGSLGAGASYSLLCNDMDRTLATDGNNPELSNRTASDDIFRYDEQTAAAYVLYNDKFGRVGLEAGVRAEYLDYRSETDEKSFSSHNLSILPNLALMYEIDAKKGHIIRLNLSRNASGMSMSSLNPNRTYTSGNSYTVGNPRLKPHHGNRADLTLTLANKLNITAGVSSSNDRMTQIYSMDDDGLLRLTYDNSARERGAEASLSMPVKIIKNLTLFPNVHYSHIETTYAGNRYKGDNITVVATAMYNIAGGWRPRLSLWWDTMNKISGNSTTLPTRPMLGVELQKNFFKNRLSTSVAVDNLLCSGKSLSEVHENGFYSYRRMLTAGPQLRLRLSYNFKWGYKSVRVQHAAGESNGNRFNTSM